MSVFAAALHGVFRFHGLYGSFLDWDSLIACLIAGTNNTLFDSISKLCVSVVVYKIWNERNKRLHNDPPIPAELVIKDCIQLVKCKLHNLEKYHKAVDSNMLGHWLL